MAATRRAVDHVVALAPPVGERVAALLDRVLAELLTLPEESGHLLHGDFKCDNILVHDDELRLLDVDRVTTGDPALDLGKFTADLRWWTRSGGVDAGPLVSAFLEGYGPCPRARRRRADLYDVMFQLRSVGRRIPLQEAGWAETVETCVTAAELCHGNAA
jgi:Ser/Thr protein kinase RdoA (MazF antagonist)